MGLLVELLAHTVIADDDLTEELVERDEDATDGDYLSEIAGRECYQSQHKPNAATEANADYLASIVRKQHLSVIEHASFTVRVSGVSRALSHELVRHRHFSYSQLSQRYVDAENADYVIHPDIAAIEDVDDRERALSILEQVWEHCMEAYGELQGILEGDGANIKRKNQAARMVLPNMTQTVVIVTGNHRAWREFLVKRLSEGADSEIRALAEQIEMVGRHLAPGAYFYLGHSASG